MLLDSREGVIKLIKSLERKLTTERLARYWTGFHGMPFALYDANNVFPDAHPNPPDGFAAEDGIFVGERTRDFVGNTVIELNGEYTALWDISTVSSVISEERLFSLIVHEMFHGFQLRVGDKRFANELLLCQYPFESKNIGLRIKEREWLVKAVFAETALVRREYTARFVSLREERRSLIGDYLTYELGLESIEGTATYVEFQAFMEETQLPKDYLAAKYGYRLAGEIDRLEDFRPSCYPSGMFICLLLDSLDPNWHHEYTLSSLYLYDFLVQRTMADRRDMKVDNRECLGAETMARHLIAEYTENKRKSIDDFERSGGYRVVLEGNMGLSKFDPMNIVSVDSMALHKHFLEVSYGGGTIFLDQSALAIISKDNLHKIQELHVFVPRKPRPRGDRVWLEDIGCIKGTLRERSGVFLVELSGEDIENRPVG